jgi:molybdopterin molybdotransferase
MISPQVALKTVLKHCPAVGVNTVAIGDVLGHVLAENFKTTEPSPRFDNTAMDGYAIRAADTTKASATNPVLIPVTQSVYAGEIAKQRVGPGEACRIMTGAPIPSGADTVAIKEEVRLQGEQVLLDHPVPKGMHIRRRGEEVRSGAVVLRKGVVVDAGVIACIASLGRARVLVFRKPAVSVIATGDETIEPGRRLRPGQIYDSNSHLLTAALKQMGIKPVRVRHVGDHPTALRNAVGAALRAGDVVIVTGGISVGDRDYLRDVLARERVKEHFWRVKQKPGKPIYFGQRGRRVVFGLPGNPASVFTCFYVYVYGALRKMAGHPGDGLPVRHLPLADGVESDPVRWRFLKAKTIDGPGPTAKPLLKQASHMISTLVDTDRLIVVPPGIGKIAAGKVVTTWTLPAADGGCK